MVTSEVQLVLLCCTGASLGCAVLPMLFEQSWYQCLKIELNCSSSGKTVSENEGILLMSRESSYLQHAVRGDAMNTVQMTAKELDSCCLMKPAEESGPSFDRCFTMGNEAAWSYRDIYCERRNQLMKQTSLHLHIVLNISIACCLCNFYMWWETQKFMVLALLWNLIYCNIPHMNLRYLSGTPAAKWRNIQHAIINHIWGSYINAIQRRIQTLKKSEKSGILQNGKGIVYPEWHHNP